jgi:hypothetical protein
MTWNQGRGERVQPEAGKIGEDDVMHSDISLSAVGAAEFSPARKGWERKLEKESRAP